MGIKYSDLGSKVVGFVKSKISWIIIIALLATIGSIVGKNSVTQDTIVTPDVMEEPMLKPLPPKVPDAVVEACVDTKSYIIETDALLRNGNFIALDLSTFELFKTKRIDSNRMGYYYRRNGAVREYYTVFKIEPKASDEAKFVTLAPKK